MQKTKWNWSEESERDGVGRRPAVLFSPAVQTRDMWLPRQAVQSGRARWTHYRQGQDGIAWQNTIGSFEELERLKQNCVSWCVCAQVSVFLWTCMCRQLSISPLRLCHPWLPPPPAPSGHKHTLQTHTYTCCRAPPEGLLKCFQLYWTAERWSGQPQAPIGWTLPLETDSEKWLDLDQKVGHHCQFIIVLSV